MQRIVIVGGGAGGLALATQLGKRLGRRKLADITLVDSARTHVWKPLLHQLAAGSFDTHAEEIEYLAQARWSHFTFRLGSLTGIDRRQKTLHLAASYDDEGGEITPEQTIPYDILVIAVGSQTNDFGTLGATGVELAAELHASARVLSNFGLDNVHPEKDLQIVLSEAALRELRKLAIEVHTNEKVVEVSANAVKMASGKVISSTLTVWAAGVKAADFLTTLGGDVSSGQPPGGQPPLETNRLNQLVVTDRLQTTRDPDIYAFGDCAACPQPGGKWVPPRAQSAYQQAMYLVRALTHIVQEGTPDTKAAAYTYLDRGSLVSLAEYSSVGSLMGSLTKGSLFVEGQLAKMMYWGLHKQHQVALGGFLKTVLIALSEWLDRTHRPRIKLY